MQIAMSLQTHNIWCMEYNNFSSKSAFFEVQRILSITLRPHTDLRGSLGIKWSFMHGDMIKDFTLTFVISGLISIHTHIAQLFFSPHITLLDYVPLSFHVTAFITVRVHECNQKDPVRVVATKDKVTKRRSISSVSLQCCWSTRLLTSSMSQTSKENYYKGRYEAWCENVQGTGCWKSFTSSNHYEEELCEEKRTE